MTNPSIDNTIANENVILWQYDNAPNFIALIKKWNAFGTLSVTEFWDYYRDFVMNIDGAEAFGLTVWGKLLNTPWPSIKVTTGTSSTTRKIGTELYRRLLKAKMYLMWKPATVENINAYLSILFPDTSAPLAKVAGEVQWYTPRNRVLDFQDMSMAYTFPKSATEDEAYLILQHYDMVYPFPAGIRYSGGFTNCDRVIGFSGQGLKNFSYNDNVMVWADETVTGEDGGIFSGTDKANYKIDPTASGKAFIYNVTSSGSVTPTIMGLTVGIRYWIDFGDGECGYLDATTDSYTKTVAYSNTGLYAICVYTDGFIEALSVNGASSTYIV